MLSKILFIIIYGVNKMAKEKSHLCLLKLNDDEYNNLKNIADKLEISISEYVTEIVRDFIQELFEWNEEY